MQLQVKNTAAVGIQRNLDDTADTAKIFAATRFNGDGIVPAGSAEAESVQLAILDVIDCAGSDLDRSGAPGVSQERVDRFFTEAEAFSAWWKLAEGDAASVLPLGDGTAAQADTFRAVKAKIDDYFARTRLVAFDARAAAPLNRDEAEYAALAARELSATAQELASFPLARIEAGKPLPLRLGVNPAWAEAIHKLAAEVIKPVLGEKTEITDAQWSELSARFAAFEAWRAAKAGPLVEKLGLPRVRELLASGAKAAIDELILQDKALEPEATAIASVDKLIRYHRDLYTLVNNFVTFRDFYSRKKKALFQAGTLYLDGRSCDLCVKVADPATHATLATLSGTYLAYCDCTRKATGEKMVIAAAFTDGDSDELMVGRNGLFYDRAGRDWDATIVKIVSHPISVRQAFWLPYKRFARMVGEQIEKFAASRDKEVHEKTASRVVGVGPAKEPAAPAAAAAAPTTFDIAKYAGIFAAVGIAVGAIGTALTAMATGFLHLAWWQMPLAVCGIILAISGPSMLIAWLRLRQRNLGPILDANGWAVNARAKINIPFGRSLTGIATLPENAERSLDDPFAEPKPAWKRYGLLVVMLVVLGVAWELGYVDIWFARLKTAGALPPVPSAVPSVVPSAVPSAAPAAPAPK